LPRLFAQLDLLDGPRFRDETAAHRAVHLLEFMAAPDSDAAEHLLVLNKILCGVAIGIPVERHVAIGDRERAMVESLIEGMIRNWSKLGATSIGGFRESFLQRDGSLRLEDDAWRLRVVPRAFDMLLDSVPWSFSIIKHSWMAQAVRVTWR
jgi:hypothetical protein